MAIAKVILNGDTLMDVTSDTVEAGKLLSGETATKNDGTRISGSVPLASAQTITPTESIQTAVPSGYYTTGPISVGAISSNYVGSAIPLKSAADLTQSTTDITAPAGYYSNDATYTMSMATINKLCSIKSSTGTIYGGYTVLSGAGYVQSYITRSDSLSLPTVAATTYIPSTTSQIIASYQWLTGPQTIEAIPSSYVIPSGTYSISSNGTYDVGSYKSVSVNATGEYYGIYKALANGDDIITTGAISYTAQEVQDYCDSLTSINANQFVQRNFVPSGVIFNNVTTIGSYAFGSVYANTVSGNYRGSLIYSFPNLLSISSAAFVFNTFIKEINAPNCSVISDATFNNCSYLKTINFPKCVSIGSSAFYGCFSLSTANFPACTSIGRYAFYQCSSLTLANFPACTSIDRTAFGQCSSLTDLSFPSCVSIGSYAFNNCDSLTSVNFPACTTIESYAFAGCNSLTDLSFPVCTSISDYAFNNCTALQLVSFPNCTTIGTNAFYQCSSLTTVSFPNCTTIGISAFASCSSLTTVNFPNCTSIGMYVFSNCTALTTASFPICTYFQQRAFYRCYNLISLYLTSVSSVPTLSTSVFYSTPIDGYSTSAGQYGSVYVPASLYSDFLIATNWSSISARIVSV